MEVTMQTDARFGINIFIIVIIVLVLAILIGFSQTNYMLGFTDYAKQDASNPQSGKKDAVSEKELEGINTEKFLIVYDENNLESVRLKNNIKQVLIYMKKETGIVDVKSFVRAGVEYHSVILALDRLGKLTDLDGLLNYISSGGNVFFAQKLVLDDAFYSIYRKLGIYEVGTSVNIKGIKLLSNVLVKNKGLFNNEPFTENYSLFVSLGKKSNLHAVSINNVPLLWDVPYNKGKMVVFNGSMLQLKMNRGLLAGALSLTGDNFIYPVMNMKLTYIDDFPAPFPNGIDAAIYKEYRKDLPRFYRDIWWPDIIQTATDFDLKYTGGVIEAYNSKVHGPFHDLWSAERSNLIIYGRELLKAGGELGIQGYNQQPLVIGEQPVGEFVYKTWPDEGQMKEALSEVHGYIRDAFPNYPIRTYIPPGNILSIEGKKALSRALPLVKTISSVYLGISQESEYVQEFEVRKDGRIELPRITSGYYDNSENRWIAANAVTSIGVFSHFINPKLILVQPEKNKNPWGDLLANYRNLMQDVSNRYPWLRSMTATQSSRELEKYATSTVYISRSGSLLQGYINNFGGDMYFMFRTGREVSGFQNCEAAKIDDGVYLLHIKSETFSVEWGDKR